MILTPAEIEAEYRKDQGMEAFARNIQRALLKKLALMMVGVQTLLD